MKVNIWSDVRCPFCYIGKRKFEAALDKFPNKNKVEVVWKSFQLDPNLQTRSDIKTIDYFVDAKGISRDQAKQMFAGATLMAKDVGLNFDLENSVVANSFKAHRLIQMAKEKDLGNEIEEALFKAHFEEQQNIDDPEILVKIGNSIGLNPEEIQENLASDAFEYEVKQDEMEARNLGVRGVPFFVFDDKYGISGAQSSDIFLETLEKSWKEFQQKSPALDVIEGDSCTTNGKCD